MSLPALRRHLVAVVRGTVTSAVFWLMGLPASDAAVYAKRGCKNAGLVYRLGAQLFAERLVFPKPSCILPLRRDRNRQIFVRS